MSRLRLISSYVSITVILGFTGWFALASFPLTGRPYVRADAEPSNVATPSAVVVLRQQEAVKPPVQTPAKLATRAQPDSQKPVLMALEPPQRIANRLAVAASLPSAPVPRTRTNSLPGQ